MDVGSQALGLDMVELVVKPAQYSDTGRELIRVHKRDRNSINRYDIASVKCEDTGKEIRVLCLGHDEPGQIWMDIDLRQAFGVEANSQYRFQFRKSKLWDKLCWYLGARDPAIRIPAKLATGSLILGVISFLLAIWSIFLSR